ncbi:PQQ-binding-like beta-propeller repeat protein, partial [Candidatus Bathyarchaeota archaeon]|nr:PQQ-binding-like beta-propeller repeat protein [Candidatus Bathyarchaeota archaeon]
MTLSVLAVSLQQPETTVEASVSGDAWDINEYLGAIDYADKRGITTTPWTMFGRNPSHFVEIDEDGPSSNHTLWKTPLTYSGVGSMPSVVGGKIYVNSEATLFVLDQYTGEILWSKNWGLSDDPLSDGRFTPLIVKQIVIMGGRGIYPNEGIWALDIANGDTIWHNPTISRTTSSGANTTTGAYGNPVYYSSKRAVIYTGFAGDLYSANYKYGTINWVNKDLFDPTLSSGVYSIGAPTVDNKIVYIGSYPGIILAVNADTGIQLWNYTADANVHPQSVARNGKLWFADQVSGPMANVYCLNATTGEEIWKEPILVHGETGKSGVTNGVSYSEELDMLFVPSWDGFMYAVNATTGDLIWEFQTQAYGAQTGPTIANGKLYLGSIGGGSYYTGQGYPNATIYCLDALTGQPIWNYTGSDTWRGNYFSITDGVLYASSVDGFLYAFGEGPTKTSLSIVSSNMVTSSEALITGSVLDLSPASPYSPVAGAQVSLSFAMVGGSYTNIATVTTTSDGTFTYEWTLPDSGFYNLMAEGEGDDSYGSSSATTYVGIGPASPTPQPTPTPEPTPSP